MTILAAAQCLGTSFVDANFLIASEDVSAKKEFWYSSGPAEWQRRIGAPARYCFTSPCGTCRNTRSTTMLLLKQTLGTVIKLFKFNVAGFRQTLEVAVREDPALDGKLFLT